MPEQRAERATAHTRAREQVQESTTVKQYLSAYSPEYFDSLPRREAAESTSRDTNITQVSRFVLRWLKQERLPARS